MTTPDDSPTLLRPLGGTEDLYWRFDAVCPLYFGVIARFEGPLDPASFRAALEAVRARHPLLRARIVTRDNDTPWFAETDAPMTLTFVREVPEAAFRVLEREVVTPFDAETGPLIRGVVLEHGVDDNTLVLTFHHAIADGRSATFLLRDLLRSLAQEATGRPGALEVLPLMDYYGDRIHTLRSYRSWAQFRETVGKTWSAAWRFLARVGVPKGVTPEQEIPLEQQTLVVEPRTFSPETMKRALRAAKAEGATMQCVLNAALSMAVAEEHPTRGLEATTCTQVLDVRDRLIPPVGEDCGLFASGNTSMHRIGYDTNFWDLARDIRVGLTEAIETPLPFFHPATHKSYASLGRAIGSERAKFFSELLGSLHPEGLCVSNLGRVVIDVPDSPLRITEFAFATNTNVLNSFNTSAATYGGRMVWSFSASSAVGREKLARIADRAVALIEEAVASAETSSGG